MNRPFTVQTDASDLAIGAVLTQIFDDGEHPVAYESRKLSPAEQNYPVHEKELLSIVHALKTWRCYLQGPRFTILTDNRALQFLPSQKLVSRRIARRVETSADYDYEIKYRSQLRNAAADALSRIPVVNAVAPQQPAVVEEDESDVLVADYEDWPTLIPEYITTGKVPPNTPSHIVRRLERERPLFVYDDTNATLHHVQPNGSKPRFIPFVLRYAVTLKAHKGFGHLGQKGTYELMKDRAWWPGMTRDIANFISSCVQCQLNRNDPQANKRERPHPLTPTPHAFDRWSLDFIGELPQTVNGNRWILTAICHSTNWPIAVAVPDATEQTVGKFIYSEIFMRFGCPSEILTDRGANFMAEALNVYLKDQKVKHLATSAYHPQTNGRNERFNGLLGSILTKLVGGARHKWDQFLDQALFTCRIRTHSSTGYSPFYLTYGRHPRLPGDFSPPYMWDLHDPKDVAAFTRKELSDLGFHRQQNYKYQQQIAGDMSNRFDEDTDDPLSEGTYVTKINHNRLKFEPARLGPYRIHKVCPLGTYQLVAPDGEIQKVLVDRSQLMPCTLPPGTLFDNPWYDSEQRSANRHAAVQVQRADTTTSTTTSVQREESVAPQPGNKPTEVRGGQARAKR